MTPDEHLNRIVDVEPRPFCEACRERPPHRFFHGGRMWLCQACDWNEESPDADAHTWRLRMIAMRDRDKPRDPKDNCIRVRLDLVLNIPGVHVGPLENVSLTEALVMGLRRMGVDVRDVKCASRTLEAVRGDSAR